MNKHVCFRASPVSCDMFDLWETFFFLFVLFPWGRVHVGLVYTSGGGVNTLCNWCAIMRRRGCLEARRRSGCCVESVKHRRC